MPLRQVAGEEAQVAVVLEAFLEVVLRQHLRQVVRVRHLGKFVDLPEPAHLVTRVLLEQTRQQFAGANRADRFIQACAFFVEGRDRAVVAFERLAVSAQFGIGVGHGDTRFEHGRIAGITLGQFGPRHECALRVFHRGCGPAEAEQRLVGLQAEQAHTLERAPGVFGVIGLQRRETERHVGLVAQAAVLLVGGGCAAELVEQLAALFHLAALDQRHAEVVARISADTAFAAAHAAEHRDRGGVVTARHQQVGLEQTALFFEIGRQVVFDLADRLLGLGQEAALIPNLGQVVPGAVAHRGRGAFFDQLGEDLAGFAVQPVRQQQAATQHLGFVGVARNTVEVLRHHQTRHRREVTPLIELEQAVAVVRVLHDMRLHRRYVGSHGRARPRGRDHQRGGTQPQQRFFLSDP